MLKSIVVAMGQDSSIGQGGALMWRLSDDLKRFKALTMGHPIVMGRKTYESLPKGALPGRRNIVISRSLRTLPDAEVYPSLQEAYTELETSGVEECFIIGGGELYSASLAQCDRMYLTLVAATFPQADTHFPEWQAEDWQELSRSHYAQDERNEYAVDLLVLERKH